jgi:hypothetical protein
MRRLFLLPMLVLTSCGRPATVEDCETIVERIAALELERQFPNDPDAVKREIEATKKQKHDAMLKECVGKRVTGDALDCVQKATSAKQIVEECFD